MKTIQEVKAVMNIETRVYVVYGSTHDTSSLSDDEFQVLAEWLGTVYSLGGFQKDFNNGKIYKCNVMNEEQILEKVNTISRDKLTTVKKTNRNTQLQLVMASEEIDIYIGVNTFKFYAYVNSQFYVIQ